MLQPDLAFRPAAAPPTQVVPGMISVVVAAYNEEQNVRPLVESIHAALVGYDYEIVFANDGSTDGTAREIRALNDHRIKLVDLRKNSGQSNAMAAGIDYARGEFIATLDGDLQNDPSDIPAMLARLQAEDWDVVAGVRANRQDGLMLRKLPSKLANQLIRSSTGVHIQDYGCTLKVFRQEIAKNLGLYGELHRFIPVLAQLQGASITQMDVKHHARRFGTSKYGLGRTFRVMSDLLLMVFFQKYLQRPIHLFGTLGLGVFALGMLINFYLLALKIFGHDIWGKPLLLLGVALALGGIQLITVGILAEMLMRTYYESQDKKPYQVKSVFVGQQ